MMSITDDLLLSFSGCSTLAEIEDIVLRDQGLVSIQVCLKRLRHTSHCFVTIACAAGLAALPSTPDGVAGPQFIVAC